MTGLLDFFIFGVIEFLILYLTVSIVDIVLIKRDEQGDK